MLKIVQGQGLLIPKTKTTSVCHDAYRGRHDGCGEDINFTVALLDRVIAVLGRPR